MNFDHLQRYGPAVMGRMETLIKNVKARSNSFYDSYLDLQEAFVREVLKTSNYTLDESKNSGYLLHGAEVKDYLFSQFGIGPELVEKLHDHTLKANRHKHAKEKTVSLDSVNAFMEPFYVFSRQCAGMTSVGQFAYDPAYFAAIYDALAKENNSLRQQISQLMSEAETLNNAKRISAEELAACQGVVASLNVEMKDLEEENSRFKSAISFLQTITTKRLDDIEDKVEKLDAKLTRILNSYASGHTIASSSSSKSPAVANQPPAPKPVTPKSASPVPRPGLTAEESALVKDFFAHAKVYFGADPKEKAFQALLKMFSRGITNIVVGALTFISTLFLPGGNVTFCIFGATMFAYGIVMTIVGNRGTKYWMQDPQEFFCLSTGSAAFDGEYVHYSFLPGKWRWLATLLFTVSIIGIGIMQFVSSSIVVGGTNVLGPGFAMMMSIVAIIVLIFGIVVTGRTYEFRYIVFQYKEDVIRFDLEMGQWETRKKELGGKRI